MFKKRSRPTNLRPADTLDASSGHNSPDNKDKPSSSNGENTTEKPEEDLTTNIDELILLRKLRKGKQGIDLEKLNRGEKKLSKGDIAGASDKFGLQSQRKFVEEDDEPDEFADETERMMRLVRSNNFTQQTNALDTDRHMLEFIEKEMAKRKGAHLNGETKEQGPFDPQAELYKMAQQYKWDIGKRSTGEEGDVTSSMGMLTSIPEVDLGMENRLKNIEATEKAKREMEDRRRTESKIKRGPEDEDFAAARYHRPTLRIASDIYAMNDEAREVAGLPLPRYNNSKSNEKATDSEVYDRFKKRMKR